MIHQRHRQTDSQTDGHTDGQTTCDRKTALCTRPIVHRAVKMYIFITRDAMLLAARAAMVLCLSVCLS